MDKMSYFDDKKDLQNLMSKNVVTKFIGPMEKPRVAPLMVPHPLYIELQKKSPMGMMRDYNITVIEEGKSISRKQFYKKFVSKSLPAIF